MTSKPSDSSKPNQPLQLRVVSPKSKPPVEKPSAPPSLPVAEPTTVQPAPTTTLASKPVPYGRYMVIGGLLVALGWVSQIPVPTSVRAEAWLEPDPNSRQVVYMEVPGTIKQILVEPNQFVKANQALALIETEQLDEEIGEWSLRLQEKVASVEVGHQQAIASQARIDQARIQEARSRQRVDELQQELKRMAAGVPPLQILALQNQIQALNGQVQSLEGTINTYQQLADQGASPQEKVKELQRQKSMFEAQASEQLAAVEAVKKQMRDELKAREDELNRLVASRQVAERESAAYQLSVTSQLPVIEKLQKELGKRQHQQTEHKVLYAPKSGMVISQNLYQYGGRSLPKGEPVLEIADTKVRRAVIEVRQEDADLVQLRDPVTLNPLEPGLPSLTTRIEQIVPVMKRDEQMPKSVLRVIALLNSEENQLKPEAKVYAKIESRKQIPLYEKCRREFLNLFKVRSL